MKPPWPRKSRILIRAQVCTLAHCLHTEKLVTSWVTTSCYELLHVCACNVYTVHGHVHACTLVHAWLKGQTLLILRLLNLQAPWTVDHSQTWNFLTAVSIKEHRRCDSHLGKLWCMMYFLTPNSCERNNVNVTGRNLLFKVLSWGFLSPAYWLD